MYTLGINSVYHDSSACLVEDGRVLAAAEEERFTGIKHGKRPIPFSAYELPFHAIDFCLKYAGIHLKDVDHIAYSYQPSLFGTYGDGRAVSIPLNPERSTPVKKGESPWDPLFYAFLLNAPRQLVDGVPHHLKKRFTEISSDAPPFQWHYVDHHLAHAASAFLASPFKEAAVLVLDGRGEQTTTSFYKGHHHDLEAVGQVTMPHSLGILYEEITSYLGFLHSSDEYKVMALASYGRPIFKDVFDEAITVHNNGTYTIEDINWENVFGKPRRKEDPFEQIHFDIAHSLQIVLEAKVLQLSQWLHQETRSKNLCMAGGVALNCVMNACIRDKGPYKSIWIQPAAGDAGTSLGAALWVDKEGRKSSLNGQRDYAMTHAYLGPSFSDGEIEHFLRWSKLPYRKLTNVSQETAQILVENKIIGWFQGRMEFGPRALGARSIIASPIDAQMQARLNDIKDREDFRPVAPAVLEEEATKWFRNADVSPFMLFVYDVLDNKADLIPAVRHVDGTARIQTIRREQNPAYYDLIKAFFARTGVPVIINTSFNTRGKPIVCSPRDAVECFATSPLDALVIGSFVLENKRSQHV